MRLRHFDALRPICPVCRTAGDTSPLKIGSVARQSSEHIIEGVLHCTGPQCQREYPIVDGIPILVESIREYVAANIQAIAGRSDLSETLESLLGDCCGPGSAFDAQRQQLSSYVWDHYGDFDPAEVASPPRPDFPLAGGVVRLLAAGLSHVGELPAGPLLDSGCGPGRTSFALAARGERLVLGVDLNFGLLRAAAVALQTGRVSYPRRRGGIVYDRREFAVPLAAAENVDFWCCDATRLPFAGESFAAATALNLLDSVPDPAALLASLADQLRSGGWGILACPYDWSTAVTPVEAWLGGHSQRSRQHGDSLAATRGLLAANDQLQIVAEVEHVPWHVRLHDRSHVRYDAHLLVVRRQARHPVA